MNQEEKTMNQVFTIEDLRPVRDGMTISRDSKLGSQNRVTYFSMGKDTSISQESYDRMTMYIGAAGQGTFIIGKNQKEVFLKPDMALVVPPKTLCGMQTSEGLVYTEIILENATIGYEGTDYELKAGECFRFEKNGLHSVTANGKFKMALLLVLE